MTTPLVRPSDAPARAAGTRTRSGNAMGRTRGALLAAAAACVERSGVAGTTMSGVAAAGGVAKATLYNHFRTKDDVLLALVESEVARLTAAGLAAPDLLAALLHAAEQLASSGPLRRVAADEPAVLARLLQPGDAPGWALARAGVASVLAQAGRASDDAAVAVVLRWLVAQALWPSTGPDTVLGARLLAEGLPAAPPVADEPSVTVQAEPADDAGASTPVGEPVVEPVVEAVLVAGPEEAAAPRGAAEEPGAAARRTSDVGWPA